jgi:predicted metal-binding membrane protein
MAGTRGLIRLLGQDRWIVAGALAVAAVGAAAFVVAGAGTGMSALGMAAATGPSGALLGGMAEVVTPARWTPGYAVMIFLMWWLMMVAMMVPSAAPVVLLYGALNPVRGVRGMLEFLAGYLAVWAGMSLLATGLQGALAAGGLISAMYMNLTLPWLGALVLTGAGLYQLTPLRQSCLAQCRGPVEALTRHRRRGPWAAFRMGALHGRYCLGCCWGLMALLFVGGIMNLYWILGLTLYVALEKLAPFGERLARPMGIVLVALGLSLAFWPTTPG